MFPTINANPKKRKLLMALPLNQTPPVALLKSELVPMLVFQIGLSFSVDLKKVIDLCDLLHGDTELFNPTVFNTHTESAYRMALEVFEFKFTGGPEPLWFKNYTALA